MRTRLRSKETIMEGNRNNPPVLHLHLAQRLSFQQDAESIIRLIALNF